MTFIQYVDDCAAHPGCTVISCIPVPDDRAQGGRPAAPLVWESHLDGAIHASHRINRDVPAIDRRSGGTPVTYEPPCPACAALLASSG